MLRFPSLEEYTKAFKQNPLVFLTALILGLAVGFAIGSHLSRESREVMAQRLASGSERETALKDQIGQAQAVREADKASIAQQQAEIERLNALVKQRTNEVSGIPRVELDRRDATIANLQGQINSVTQQLVGAQGQIRSLQQAGWTNIPPACTIRLIHALLVEGKLVTNLPKTMIARTYPPNMVMLADQLDRVLGEVLASVSAEASASGMPVVYPFVFGPTINYDKDLDAPRLDGRGAAGITIHGRSPMADFLSEALSSALIVHQTQDIPAEQLLAYYHRVASNYALYDNVVWLEIGSGSPLAPAPNPGCL
jgi:hypothetical protein